MWIRAEVGADCHNQDGERFGRCLLFYVHALFLSNEAGNATEKFARSWCFLCWVKMGMSVEHLQGLVFCVLGEAGNVSGTFARVSVLCVG